MDVNLFRECFAFVRDAYGLEKASGPDAIRSPLSDDLLLSHLEGKRRIGAYTTDDAGLCNQLIIDLDIPKDKVDDLDEWTQKRAEAKRVVLTFDELGVEAFITSSKSRGFHIRSLWEPAPARDLRRLGEFVVKRAGLPPTEVFPKQDARGGPEKLGNFVWLPLHGESLKTGKTAILDQENGLAPLPDQWEALRDLRRNGLETLGSVTAAIEEWEEENGTVLKAPARPVEGKLTEGTRRDTLFSLAGTLRARGLEGPEILPTLREVNASRCEPVLDDEFLVEMALGVERYPPGRQLDANYHLSDLGNAQRLAVRLNGLGRYCFPFKAWFLYDGQRWVQDKSGEIVTAAKQTVRDIYEEAKQANGEVERKRVAAHAIKSEGERAVNAMINLARSEPGIPVDPSEFDRNPWLLNFLNGTVDLRTGKIQPHSPTDLITQMVSVSYDKDAPRDRWLKTLDEIFLGRKELVSYVHRLFGYGSTGITTEHVFPIFHGSGRNGKNTILDTVLKVMGDYATTTNFSTFAVQRGEGVRNDLAELYNKRLVTTSESTEGQRLDEGLVKRATGDAFIKSRFLFKEFFSYERKFKVIAAVNHLPKIRGTDLAIWERVQRVPFDAVFLGDDQDKDLGDKLMGEAAGMAAWIVEGAMSWHKMGLCPPDIVKAETTKYREDEDVLGNFIRNCCDLSEEVRQPANAMFQSFLKYSGLLAKNYSQKNFKEEMEKAGFISKRTNTGSFWMGIAVQDEYDVSRKQSRG